MALYFFRLISYSKDYLIRFLNYVFSANAKGVAAFRFYDGTKETRFTNTPFAIKKFSWTDRKLPVILIRSASGSAEYESISKDLVDGPIPDDPNTEVREFGGKIKLTIDIEVLAKSIPERDNLIDILIVFLGGPLAKDYFYKHGLVLPSGPRVGAEREISIPNIDYPVYSTSISMEVHGLWRDKEDPDLTLEDIITDIDVEVEL